MKIAAVVSLVRLVAAWMVLTTLILTFGLQLATQFREFQMASWLAAGRCIQAALPEAVSSIQAGTKANP